jgi:hypothetical protein
MVNSWLWLLAEQLSTITGFDWGFSQN